LLPGPPGEEELPDEDGEGGRPFWPPGPNVPAGPLPDPPIPTDVAVTVFDVSVPKTATWVPTVTSASDADALPDSRYVVDVLTSTVTVVPSWVVRVKVFVPTDFTVPNATGGVPPGPPGRSPGPPGPPGPPVPPMATLVAVTVPEASVPKTATWSPTLRVEKVGDVTDGSR
jgi:hypothetical protein